MTNNDHKVTISIIAAMSENGVIGNNGKIPWYLPADFKHFKEVTTGKPIVMGRKTFESLPNGALPNRINIVITRNKSFQAKDCTVVNSLDEAIKVAGDVSEIMIIGGAQIYQEALPIADKMYLTIVHESFKGDTYFPKVDYCGWEQTSKTFNKVDERNKHSFTFKVLEKQ